MSIKFDDFHRLQLKLMNYIQWCAGLIVRKYKAESSPKISYNTNCFIPLIIYKSFFLRLSISAFVLQSGIMH